MIKRSWKIRVPINEVSIERMTRGKGTLHQLSPAPLLEFPVFPPIVREYEPFFEEDGLGDQDRLVESPPIVHVSDVENEENSRDVKESMRRIDSLIKDDTIATQEAFAVEEEDVHAEVAEVTSEEHHNSLAIVVYTGPLKVTPPTQEVADDAGVVLEIEE
ncbi:hypothetical protein PVK06_020394 [Gossypium arboreum]|uniref:Uncharacterized protein n=1 Tax=Gossypium arboreum TaxID=29729 RepID=A0ABR0PMQ0_GOSAR|nr:hypothetical protein PVK06_020394 [Gossypium arboreum]